MEMEALASIGTAFDVAECGGGEARRAALEPLYALDATLRAHMGDWEISCYARSPLEQRYYHSRKRNWQERPRGGVRTNVCRR